jgi:predicted membrane-bound spermidine synthase
MVVLFFLSLSIILFELALTRIFSIVLWYDYAFMAISIAFFGLGIGSFVIHIQRVKIKTQKKKSPTAPQFAFSSRIVQFAIAYGISVPVFIFLIGYIPSDTSYIYLFYLISSIPFFFAGACMALIFLAMSERISKLYFADLIGAASATIILDPVMQTLGAGSVLLLTSVAVVGASACSYYFVFIRDTRDRKGENLHYHAQPNAAIKREKVNAKPRNRLSLFAAITFAGLVTLLIVNSVLSIGIFEIKPGMSKGLYYQVSHPLEFEHLSEEWNSFSRVDVSHKIIKQEDNNILVGSPHNNAVATTDTDSDSGRELASIIIDADAATPIFRWDGSQSDLAWIQKYMDYLPYKMINANNTLVIGSGGGEDILVALSGGADNVTAIELNPLVVSAVKSFGNQSGNIYTDDDNNNVDLFIDDGRRFISSTTEKFDVIVLKLVDSWAAQLAGGYALSENYLYTVEAFQQYLRHLDKENGGMLVMTRWNFELPRLIPLIVDSLVKETGESRDSVAKHMMVVEDRPGLYFGRSDDNQKYYPVLVMVKSTPFDDRQITMVNEEAQRNHAEITMLADSYVAAAFSKLFNNDNAAYKEYFSTTAAANPTIPTDNSPFYFAREQVPKQMIILLATVVAISGLVSVLLIYHARKARIQFNSRSRFHILFAIFIGLGFMILEVTFIQKFLLLLGTPIMALTVILFSILLSSGIGSYISGKIFSTRRSHRGVLTSIPILSGIIIVYFLYLQEIMASTISMELPYRIALTFGLLFPAGFLMGFQFPSLIRMASLSSSTSSASSIAVQGKNEEMVYGEEYNNNKNNNTTLLWGINIIASIIGTVVAVIVAMIIGFNGNLLIGLCMYLGAGTCALFSLYYMRNNRTRAVSIGGNF